jgi:membrane fusion protein (multidrug efflux system)
MPPFRLRRTPLLVLTLAVLIGLGSIWAFYTSEGATKAREREARLQQARSEGPSEPGPSLEVQVAIATATSRTEIAELSGVLEPIRATWVASEVAGRVVEVPAEEYAPVASGGLLVRLDSSLPRAELIRAEAGHRLAKSELERQERLGSRSVASEAELERARAEERRSYAALLEARTRLEYTRITAPYDGLVNSLDLDPGAYVQPGTPIAEILDLSQIELKVLVGDRQVNALRPGSEVDVRVDALGNQRFAGRIARVAGAPEDDSQRYPVVVMLDNDEGRLRPGMLASVLFELGTTPAIRLPARAVQNEFELDYVYVLDENDMARRARVSTRPVPFRPDLIEVSEGLAVGDRVAISGVESLREGLRVIAR